LLRFRFDGEDQGWSTRGPHSEPESEHPHGHDHDDNEGGEPRPLLLSRGQQIEFLKLVHDGLGRLMACSQIKVGERALKRTLARVPSFRRALEHVERMRAENLYSLLYSAALRGDLRTARFLLARHDREEHGMG
jgi:hypothetical protein